MKFTEFMREMWLSETTEQARNSCCGRLTAPRKIKSPVADIVPQVQCYTVLVAAVLVFQHLWPITTLSLILSWGYHNRLSKDLNWSRTNPTLYSLGFTAKAVDPGWPASPLVPGPPIPPYRYRRNNTYSTVSHKGHVHILIHVSGCGCSCQVTIMFMSSNYHVTHTTTS